MFVLSPKRAGKQHLTHAGPLIGCERAFGRRHEAVLSQIGVTWCLHGGSPLQGRHPPLPVAALTRLPISQKDQTCTVRRPRWRTSYGKAWQNAARFATVCIHHVNSRRIRHMPQVVRIKRRSNRQSDARRETTGGGVPGPQSGGHRRQASRLRRHRHHPALSEKATLLPSGENEGSDSSAGSFVSRTGAPPATCCTQMSRLPSPLRSEA